MGTSRSLRGVIALLVVVAMAAAVAACGGSPKPTSNSTAPQSTKTATQTGGGPVRSAAGSQTSGHPADNSVSGCETSMPRVHCHAATHARHARDPRRRRAADKSALAARAADGAVRPARSGDAAICQAGACHPRRCSASSDRPKWLRTGFSIGWGNAGEGHRGTTIVVDGCSGPPGAKWLVYAGGFYVRDPFCAPLTVAADQQRRRVRIGVGKACPGQRPPPQPTQG